MVEGDAGAGRELFAGRVLWKVPGKAHRAVAVADVERAGRDTHGLGKRTRGADDKIGLVQAELREGERIERKVALMATVDTGQVLEPCRADIPGTIEARKLFRGIHGGVDGRIRKEFVEDLEDTLGTTVLVQVVVNDRNPHDALHLQP